MAEVENLRSHIKEIREVIDELLRITAKSYETLNRDEKYSIRYQIVVLVEAMGSLCLHIVIEDLGHEPESYSECFKLFEEHGNINCAEDLIVMGRLRGLLVHRYWIIDDAKIYQSIKENFQCVETLLSWVSKTYGL